jgi:hypothetical protein
MKKLVFAALATVLFFAACSKDDENPTTTAPAGSFTFNDTTANLYHGYLQNFRSDGNSIALSDSALVTTFAGKINAIGFDVDSLIPGTTYTYKDTDTEGYDKTKNFDDAYAYYGSNWKEDGIDESTGRVLEGIVSGSLTYNKTGDISSFTYTFQFPTAKITGSFKGNLELVQ